MNLRHISGPREIDQEVQKVDVHLDIVRSARAIRGVVSVPPQRVHNYPYFDSPPVTELGIPPPKM